MDASHFSVFSAGRLKIRRHKRQLFPIYRKFFRTGRACGNTASSGKASGSESVEAFAPSGNSKTYDPVPNKNWFGIDRLKFKAFIRKSGHFCLFMGLGALVLLTLRSYYSDWPEQKSVLWRVHLSAWLACVCYAFCDEFHQLFVKGRDARFRDVFIDSCGALVGVLLTVLVLKLIACMRRKHIPKRKIS